MVPGPCESNVYLHRPKARVCRQAKTPACPFMKGTQTRGRPLVACWILSVGGESPVQEPLDSHGSRCSAVAIAQEPMGEEVGVRPPAARRSRRAGPSALPAKRGGGYKSIALPAIFGIEFVIKAHVDNQRAFADERGIADARANCVDAAFEGPEVCPGA
jgi:hypothetical protein